MMYEKTARALVNTDLGLGLLDRMYQPIYVAAQRHGDERSFEEWVVEHRVNVGRLAEVTDRLHPIRLDYKDFCISKDAWGNSQSRLKIFKRDGEGWNCLKFDSKISIFEILEDDMVPGCLKKKIAAIGDLRDYDPATDRDDVHDEFRRLYGRLHWDPVGEAPDGGG